MVLQGLAGMIWGNLQHSFPPPMSFRDLAAVPISQRRSSRSPRSG